MEETQSRCPGLTGLMNLGNTCYMNAILQCLCSLPQLVEYFLSGKHKTAQHKEIGQSAIAFGCLMSDMWLGEFDCVSPEAFHSVLEKRYPAFRKTTQQDAQEFLICVLNELHEALKSSERRCVTDAKASRGSVSETSIITQLFEGQLSYEITCLECKTTTERPESFTVLSLPVPSKSMCSLGDCLKCFFQQDTLTWNNQIHCSWCGTKQDAVVKATITKAPQIIIFHLKRFEWQDKHKGKLSTTICYPLSDLDLSPYTAQPVRRDAEYSLCAVVNHSGFLDDGHYTAFCEHSVTKNWYRFDDDHVTEIPNSSVQSDTAYLLFYTCQGLPCTH
ncbi:ubiquitin carboxyl-terminal hydrolase 50 [Numenius arquata]|uniref:ubiquitin carboxyl-terminal hydrolase 50 n=1 Tax=Numenius arquata TaxID=31919 RepID=UPI003D30BE50